MTILELIKQFHKEFASRAPLLLNLPAILYLFDDEYEALIESIKDIPFVEAPPDSNYGQLPTINGVSVVKVNELVWPFLKREMNYLTRYEMVEVARRFYCGTPQFSSSLKVEMLPPSETGRFPFNR